MQPETLHSRWAGTPLLAWARGMGKPNTRAGKTPHLRFQIRQICTLSSSLGQSASPAWSHRWVSVRITPWALKVETRPTKICVLLVAGSYPISVSQMPSDGAPQIPLQSLWCKIIVGGPIKQPKMLGDGWWSPWILFSHWRKQRLRRDLCMVLRWPPLTLWPVCLGLCASGCFGLPPCFRILSVVSLNRY